MSSTSFYDKKIIETFRKNALRTVLLIDDQFPTFADLANIGNSANAAEMYDKFSELDKRYKERKEAIKLYSRFGHEKMPCDIINDTGPVDSEDFQSTVERIRKSDLIILDYNLDGDGNGPSKSIEILKKLSETDHFNTVVLYTKDRDLAAVWRMVATSLRGGWKKDEDLLDENTQEILSGLQDSGAQLPSISAELLSTYVIGGKWKDSSDCKKVRSEWEEIVKNRGIITKLIEYQIHQEVRALLMDRAPTSGPKSVCGGYDNPFWLQAGNCFIALVTKSADYSGAASDYEDIIASLDAALKRWRPSLLQILISEIQNILELEPMSSDEMHLNNPDMQVGLTYYLLKKIGKMENIDSVEHCKPGIEAVIDRLLDGVRRKFTANLSLSRDAAELFSEEIKKKHLIDSMTSDKGILDAAIELSGFGKLKNSDELMFKLNSFLSMETFSKGHITTGTVFRNFADADKAEYWICLSPACDMADREPSGGNQWLNGIYPAKPTIIVKLDKSGSLASTNKDATSKNIIFLIDNKNDINIKLIGLSISKGSSNPSYEFVFPLNAGRVHAAGSSYPKFSAFRIGPKAGGDERILEIEKIEFEVVGQLRSQYASRLLQVMGQHFSRIGVDLYSHE